MAKLLQKSEAALTAVKVFRRTAHGTLSVVHASVMQSSHCSKISSHVLTKLSPGKVLCVLRLDKKRAEVSATAVDAVQQAVKLAETAKAADEVLQGVRCSALYAQYV